jgi:hypothetical protein
MTASEPDFPSVPVRQDGPYTWSVLPPPFDPAETARIRTRVAALEAKCAAMTDALSKTTHGFTNRGHDPLADACAHVVAPYGQPGKCYRPATDPVHRTPAVVRAELEAGP